jgi:hypothetical protein
MRFGGWGGAMRGRSVFPTGDLPIIGFVAQKNSRSQLADSLRFLTPRQHHPKTRLNQQLGSFLQTPSNGFVAQNCQPPQTCSRALRINSAFGFVFSTSLNGPLWGGVAMRAPRSQRHESSWVCFYNPAAFP